VASTCAVASTCGKCWKRRLVAPLLVGPPHREVTCTATTQGGHLPGVCAHVQVRAEQSRRGVGGNARVMALLVHGDAAFAGLGGVAECLQLADVPGFSTGGTVHVIINNQVDGQYFGGRARQRLVGV